MKLRIVLTAALLGAAILTGLMLSPAHAQAPLGKCEGILDYPLNGLEEVSSHSYFIHVQYYVDGNPERETLLPSGRYPVLANLKGHIWELGPSCTPEQALQRHVGPSIQHRAQMGANTAGYVGWEQLVTEGLISVAWQAQPVPIIPSLILGLVVSPAPAGAGCKATHVADSDGMAVIAAVSTTLTVETWGGDLGTAIVVIPSGESIPRTWQGGAIWNYGAVANVSDVIRDVEPRGLPVYQVVGGNLVLLGK